MSNTTIETTNIPRSPNSSSNQHSASDDYQFFKSVFIRGRVLLDSTADIATTFGSASCSIAGGIEAGGSFRTLGNAIIEKTLTINSPTQGIVALNSPSSFQSLQVLQGITSATVNASTSITTATLNSTNGNVTHVVAGDLSVTANSALNTLSCSGASVLADMTCANTSVTGTFIASGSASTFQGGPIKLTKINPLSTLATLSLADDGSFQLQQNANYNINMITNGIFSILGAGSSTSSFSCGTSACTVTVPLSINTTATSTGAITSGDTLTASKNLLVKAVTGSSSSNQGAAVISGGLGVGERINAANDISTLTTLRGNNVVSTNLATLGSVLITSTVNSTSPSSGSFITAGGAYIGQDLRVANNVYITSTADVVNGMPCSFQTQGGMNIASKLAVGSLITGGNGLTITGAGNFSGTLAASSPIYANSQLNATSVTSAALVSAGGLAVARDIVGGGLGSFMGALSTQAALSVASTLTCGGDATFSGNMNVAKNLICSGGGTFMGDVAISGGFTVGGVATQVNWRYMQTNDNIILVNSGPLGISDSGYCMGRFQLPNDNGTGSVVQDVPFFNGTCAGTSNSTTTINLGSSASSVDSTYNEMWIMDSNNQVRKIKSYVGSTQVATIYSTADQTANNNLSSTAGSTNNDSSGTNAPQKWSFKQGMDYTTVATSTTTYKLFNRHYVMQAFLEANNTLVLGSTPINPTTSSSANIQQTESLKFKSGYLDGTLYSDTVSPYTTNGPINVGGVTVQNGKLSNVTSLNGIKALQTVTVQVIDNASTSVSLPTSTYGIYMIHISPTTSTGSAFSGRLMMFNNNLTFTGDFQTSASGEQISPKWVAGNAIQIFHSKLKTNGTGASITYNVLIEAKS